MVYVIDDNVCECDELVKGVLELVKEGFDLVIEWNLRVSEIEVYGD